MSIDFDPSSSGRFAPSSSSRYVLRDDAKPAVEAPWYWPLPRLAGESPRIVSHAHDDRLGVDIGYSRVAFPDLFVPVYAACGGTISFAARVTSGHALTIDHGGVWSTHYAHLEQMFVTPTLGRRKRRMRVRAGDVIGYAGREPSHIRFELWKWTSKDGYVPTDAARVMHKWLVLPQFTTGPGAGVRKPGPLAA
jgi:murein DD-endopeptidase MepM/ murein hydrolase activator NlpD